MNGTQVVEKEKLDLSCSAVEVLSFQEIVDAFVEKCSNQGAKADLRKTVTRYSLGLMKEGLFNNSMRVRSYPRAEVNALKEQLSTTPVISVLECVYDMLVFNTSKDDAIKASLSDEDDLEYALSIVDLKSLDLKQTIYTLPDDIDSGILKLRIPESRKINTQSKLGQLVEEYLESSLNMPSFNVSIRKLFAQYTLGQINEVAVANKAYNHETPYRRTIQYINKNYKAIQSALEAGKGDRSFKDDADYVTLVMKA